MATRDKARSDMYLAQLKSQSAPNTPGLPGGLLSPRDGGWVPPQGFEAYNKERAMEEGTAAHDPASPTQYATRTPTSASTSKPFTLQPAPIRGPASHPVRSNSQTSAPYGSPPVSPVHETVRDHVPAAPGETRYESVAVPGAYVPPASAGVGGFDFGTGRR